MKTTILTTALVLLTMPIVTGAVLDADDPVFGSGALTRDTEQNLDFLDLTFSQGRSYNDVVSHLVVGGDFESFRIAEESEVIELINNFGFSPGAVAGSNIIGDTGGDQLAGLVDLMGQTSLGIESGTGLLVQQATGYTSTSAGLGVRIVQINDYELVSHEDFALAGFSERVDESLSYIGTYLVRVIPEPTTSALALAALCLAMSRRRM